MIRTRIGTVFTYKFSALNTQCHYGIIYDIDKENCAKIMWSDGMISTWAEASDNSFEDEVKIIVL